MKLALICLLALAVIAGVVADKNTASVINTVKQWQGRSDEKRIGTG